jgi:hypothetical protein
MCVRTYVSMCVCVYACIYAFMHVCMYICSTFCCAVHFLLTPSAQPVLVLCWYSPVSFLVSMIILFYNKHSNEAYGGQQSPTVTMAVTVTPTVTMTVTMTVT